MPQGLRAAPCHSRAQLLPRCLPVAAMGTSGPRAGFPPDLLRPTSYCRSLDGMGTWGVCVTRGSSLCPGTPVPSSSHTNLVADPSPSFSGDPS